MLEFLEDSALIEQFPPKSVDDELAEPKTASSDVVDVEKNNHN